MENIKLLYKGGQQVQVYDRGKKRWLKAKILYLVHDDPNLKAWEVELRNGARGIFDHHHIRSIA